jgi:hypothetical protein
MTPQPMQRTRLQGVLSRIGGSLLRQLRSSWRAGSFSLLALLGGFYLAQNLTALLIIRLPGGRPLLVLGLVLVIELMVRLRSRLLRGEPPLGWVIADNVRVGAVYAVVLEAFKLGS